MDAQHYERDRGIFLMYSTNLAHPVDVYDKCTFIKWLFVADGDKHTTLWQRDKLFLPSSNCNIGGHMD